MDRSSLTTDDEREDIEEELPEEQKKEETKVFKKVTRRVDSGLYEQAYGCVEVVSFYLSRSMLSAVRCE